MLEYPFRTWERTVATKLLTAHHGQRGERPDHRHEALLARSTSVEPSQDRPKPDHPTDGQAKGPHPNRVAPPIEKAILAHALKHPTHGAQRVADELMLRGLRVSSSGVRGVWIRNGLKTRHERLLRLEETVHKRKIRLTEEQIRALERFDPEFRERHIEVHATGELVAVDTFFAGTLRASGRSTSRRCSTASAATSGPGSTPRRCP